MGCELRSVDTMMAGAKVFAGSDVIVLNRLGPTVAASWGDPGTVERQCDESGDSWVIRWDCRRDTKKPGVTSAPGSSLLMAPPRFVKGQWLRLTRAINFLSSRQLPRGHSCVVLDVHANDRPRPQRLQVHATQWGLQMGFDLSVLEDEVEPMADIPEGMKVDIDALPGGYKAGQVAYARHDICIEDGVPLMCRGDAGTIFSHVHDNHVLLRLDAKRDVGKKGWLSIHVNDISPIPQLCQGRRVKLVRPFTFADGFFMNAGHSGTLLNAAGEAGSERNIVQIDSSMEGDRLRQVEVDSAQLEIIDEPAQHGRGREARLEQLEWFAQKNDAAGRTLWNTSLLDQVLWAVVGLGSGIGRAPLGGDRTTAIANTTQCLTLRKCPNSGLDSTLQNQYYVVANHAALVADASRTEPYATAIERAAKDRRALDIGTGPSCVLARFCLRAGASSVSAIEASGNSFRVAADILEAELAGKAVLVGGEGDATLVPPTAALEVLSFARDTSGRKVTASVAGDSGPRCLDLHHGLSTDVSLPLQGKYSLVVHEILGDIAGVEGAMSVIADIKERELVTDDCVFIPRSACTMMAPTEVLNLKTIEKLVFRMRNHGTGEIEPLARYACRHFRREALLASPQPIEVLDFANELNLHQRPVLEFRTEREADFDGLHMHLRANLDDTLVIDTLDLHSKVHEAPDRKRSLVSSWSTTYIKLLAKPIRLPVGSRIACRCDSDLTGSLARYSISVCIGEPGAECHVADICLEGCAHL